MEIEQNELNDQTIYPRILFEQMEQFKGRKVTLAGYVYKEDLNDSLVIECGPSGQQYFVIVDNQRKVDLNSTTQFVEVRGAVMSQNVINCEELTEFEQKEPFDFETYSKFVNLTYNDKLKHLFSDS